MTEAPLRLCCGQSHDGAQCPDGLVMCCICFDRFAPGDLYADVGGETWDMCRPCGEKEDT